MRSPPRCRSGWSPRPCWALALGVVAALACDGTRSRTDADAADAVASVDAAAVPDAATGVPVEASGAAPAAPDAGPRGDGPDALIDYGPPPAPLPLPAGVRPPQQFLGADAQLAGDGESACSRGPDALWCAFYRAQPGRDVAELWVIDLAGAAAGDIPRCDGSSARCRRLTATLWTGSPLGGPSHPFSHRFAGDTLIYYADAPATPFGELYRGPVYAWRPDWDAPRAVTSALGLMCLAHERAPLVYCIEDVRGDPMRPESFELRVGSLAPGAPPLHSLGRLQTRLRSGEIAWQAGFAGGGLETLFAYSSPEPSADVEVLRVVAAANPGAEAPREVLRGAAAWTIARDGGRIYYLRANGPERGLYARDFPGGGAEVELDPRVTDYLLLGRGERDDGAAFLSPLTPERSAFRFVRSSRMPMPVTVFSFRNPLEGVRMSDDLRYTVWRDGSFTARIVHNADGTTCRLNANQRRAAFDPLFSGSAGLVFWAEDPAVPDADRLDGFAARPHDCEGRRKFAAGLSHYTPVGDRALVFTDEATGTTPIVTTLKYAPVVRVGEAWQLGPPVRVHGGVEHGYFTLVGADGDRRPLVLFRTHGPEAGTFVFGPLPLE